MSRQERYREIREGRKKFQRRSPAKDYDPMRRNIIKAGLIGAGLVAFGGISYLLKEASESGSDEEIILGEAKRLGINPSMKEQSLWGSSYLNTGEYISPPAGDYELMKDRSLKTLGRMSKSENPYFKKASDYLFIQARSGIVKFVSLAPGSGGDGTSAGVGYGISSSGQFEYEFNISPNFVLNQSSGLTLAGVFTHEVAHIRRFEEYRSEFSRLPPAEQVAKLDRHLQNREQQVTEEAFAYGVEADGYIYQAGLLGSLYDVKGSGQEDRAAAYVRFGKDASSRQWKNYLVEINASHLSR